MDREWLERELSAGRSVESLAREVGKHGSTVTYWMRKHGLVSQHAEKYAPRGSLDPNQLRTLVDRGLTVRQIAAQIGRGTASVRHWLKRYGLQTELQRAYAGFEGKPPPQIWRHCRTHGRARFVRTGRKGHYRCAACRARAVSERRRRVKRILVQEAGGRCIICGYERYVGALQFHHLDPGGKEFVLSLRGATRGIRVLREEARKCALLCANCHAEVEAGVATIEEAKQTTHSGAL